MKHTTMFLAALILAGTFFTPASAATDMNAWKRALAKAIASHQTYPRAALMREIEGRAKVRLVVAADGSITAHEVLEATGKEVLDREIPKLIARLNPLPPLPAGQDGLKLVLPLEWSLQ